MDQPTWQRTEFQKLIAQAKEGDMPAVGSIRRICQHAIENMPQPRLLELAWFMLELAARTDAEGGQSTIN